jgi:4-carboxymuconolactone decarboxylase
VAPHPDEGMRRPAPRRSLATVDPAEDLLRRLALNDETVLGMVLTGTVDAERRTDLGAKVELLVKLGALLALGATTPSVREAVERASAAGASTNELVGVLVSLGPTIGLASLVAAASKLATAIGYDLENGHGPPGVRRRPAGAR